MIPNFSYAPGSAVLGNRTCELIQQGNLIEVSNYGKCRQVREAFPTWKVFIKIANDTPAGRQFRFYSDSEASEFVAYIQNLQPIEKRIVTTVHL